jgi:hypothetical protein
VDRLASHGGCGRDLATLQPPAASDTPQRLGVEQPELTIAATIVGGRTRAARDARGMGHDRPRGPRPQILDAIVESADLWPRSRGRPHS